MKRIIAGLLVIFALFEASYLYAVNQPNSLGYVSLSLSSGTVTAITNSTAPAVGYMLWCTNCLGGGGAGTLCISTGTAKFNQFVLSTGTVCI